MSSLNNYLWDTSLPLFKLEGADCRTFLNSQTTFDVLRIKEGTIFRTCWLSPVGRFKALLEGKMVGGCIEFVVLLGDSQELIDGLNKVIFPVDRVNVIACDQVRRLQIISMNQSWKETATQWLSNKEKTPQSFLEIKDASKTILQEWKIKQGLPDRINHIIQKCNPFEIGLSDFVDLEKGCYLGQETLSKVKNMGNLKHQLRFFEYEGKLNSDEKLILSSENGETNSNENGGFVFSSMLSGDNNTIGLAMIRRRFSSYDNLKLGEARKRMKIKIPLGFKGIDDIKT